MSWNGKVVVVTGAGSGIGAATAELFAEAGANVVVVDMNAAAGGDCVRRIEKGGARALFVPADISNEHDVRLLAERVVAEFGRVDVLVNNAGIMRRHERLEEWPLDEFRRVIDINLTSLFVSSQIFAPIISRSGGGAIINISSLGAVLPVSYSPCYAAAKAGVLALTRSMAPLLQPMGVRVNAVLPSLVDTPMIKDSPVRGQLPPGTVLRPMDIATAVAHVAADASVTGGFFSVNGTPDGPRLSRVIDPPAQVEETVQPFVRG
jgi:3-oxoacyl-[acyl-carrier protein] reductase